MNPRTHVIEGGLMVTVHAVLFLMVVVLGTYFGRNALVCTLVAIGNLIAMANAHRRLRYWAKVYRETLQ